VQLSLRLVSGAEGSICINCFVNRSNIFFNNTVMKLKLKIRLSIMMFVQFTALGTVVPVIAHYFKNSLGFSGNEIGMLFACASLTGFISPFIGSIVADRIISAARLLALCNVGAGIFLLVTSYSSSFKVTAISYLLYALLIGPVIALTNAITFHNATDAKKQFTPIRLWGTVGFIAIAWVCILFAPETSNNGDSLFFLRWSIRVGALISIAFAFYALTLPRHRLHVSKNVSFLPVDSFRVLCNRDTAVLITTAFLITAIDKFHFFAVAPFLSQNGFADAHIMPVMSIGQVVEIIAIMMTATLLGKIGFKKLICIGLLLEAIRFACYAIGSPVPFIYIGLAVHGFVYAFIFLGIAMWIDSRCSAHTRTGVHQISAMLLGGLAGIVGNLLCGKMLDHFSTGIHGLVDFSSFWIIPAGASLFVLVFFIIFFKSDAACR
jgi:nucleoside transporter